MCSVSVFSVRAVAVASSPSVRCDDVTVVLVRRSLFVALLSLVSCKSPANRCTHHLNLLWRMLGLRSKKPS